MSVTPKSMHGLCSLRALSYQWTPWTLWALGQFCPLWCVHPSSTPNALTLSSSSRKSVTLPSIVHGFPILQLPRLNFWGPISTHTFIRKIPSSRSYDLFLLSSISSLFSVPSATPRVLGLDDSSLRALTFLFQPPPSLDQPSFLNLRSALHLQCLPSASGSVMSSSASEWGPSTVWLSWSYFPTSTALICQENWLIACCPNKGSPRLGPCSNYSYHLGGPNPSPPFISRILVIIHTYSKCHFL